jgi:hypothetical protein
MKVYSNRPKGVVMAVFCISPGCKGIWSYVHVAGMHGNLIVCPHQIDLGEEATTREVVGIIVDVTDGIAVGDGSSVKRSIVTEWTQTVVFLGHDMES